MKKSGKNLLEASDKIKKILHEDLINKEFPKDLKVTLTGEQSRYTRNTLEELNNTIIIGMILVTLVLMFLWALPMHSLLDLPFPFSMAVAFMVMPALGFYHEHDRYVRLNLRPWNCG